MNATARQGLLAARIALAQAKESSAALPPGDEVEGGTHPARVPLSTPALYARCDACGFSRVPAKSMNLICVQERQSWEPKWLLVCGPCLVDGAS